MPNNSNEPDIESREVVRPAPEVRRVDAQHEGTPKRRKRARRAARNGDDPPSTWAWDDDE